MEYIAYYLIIALSFATSILIQYRASLPYKGTVYFSFVIAYTLLFPVALVDFFRNYEKFIAMSIVSYLRVYIRTIKRR